MAETSEIPLRNVEPNKLIHLANLMRGGQDKLNYLRGAGVGPLGDLFLGPATDVVEGAAYGELPTTGSGQTTQLDPGVFDLAAMGTVPVAAGKNVLQKLMASKLRDKPKDGIYQQLAKGGINEKGVNQQIAQGAVPAAAIGTAVDQGRRDFLKAGAGAVGLGAIASKSPSIAKSLLKDTAEAAVPAAARGLAAYTPEVAKKAMSVSMDSLMGGANNPLIAKIIAEAPKEVTEQYTKKLDDLVGKYGDDFEPDGFAERMSMTHPDAYNVFSKGRNKNPTDAEMKKSKDWFNSQPYEKQEEIIEHWQVTGKYPGESAEKLKNVGHEFEMDWVTRHMDQHTGALKHDENLLQYVGIKLEPDSYLDGAMGNLMNKIKSGKSNTKIPTKTEIGAY